MPASKFAQHALRKTHINPTINAMREIVGKNIRSLRKAKDWTIEELAAGAGSDVGNISRLERGKQGFSDKILEKIAKALGVDPIELFKVDTPASKEQAKPVAVIKAKKHSDEVQAIINMCESLSRDDQLVIKGYVEGKYRERFPNRKASAIVRPPGSKANGRRAGENKSRLKTL